MPRLILQRVLPAATGQSPTADLIGGAVAGLRVRDLVVQVRMFRTLSSMEASAASWRSIMSRWR